MVNMYTRLEIYIKQQIRILKNYNNNNNNNNNNKKTGEKLNLLFPRCCNSMLQQI